VAVDSVSLQDSTEFDRARRSKISATRRRLNSPGDMGASHLRYLNSVSLQRSLRGAHKPALLVLCERLTSVIVQAVSKFRPIGADFVLSK
jgi:hypothetical protein